MSKITIVKNVKWNKINWIKIEKHVSKLQEKIYRHSTDGNVKKLRKVQCTLLNSFEAKLLAVRKVTQDNRGKNTPGVDGIKITSGAERVKLAERLKISNKSDPIKRVWIPKANGKLRPLGIPTIHDRSLQALVKMAIEPEHEAKFESNSYGFRPGRGARDAIKHVHTAITGEAKYVVDADIEKCFDKINHDKLLELCGYAGKLKAQIRAWLKAGIMEELNYHIPEEGTPQGGVISPLLANIALDGIQIVVKMWCQNHDLFRNGIRIRKKDPETAMHFNRYADDFRIFYHELEPLKEVLKDIEIFLKARGLNLSSEKTKIVHTLLDLNGPKTAGVDYLGFRIKHFTTKHRTVKKKILGTEGELCNLKLRIYPTPEKIKAHFDKLRKLTEFHKNKSQKILIGLIVPVTIGWTNYFKYSHLSSMSMGRSLERKLFWVLRAWALGKLKNSAQSNARKYWIRYEDRRVFGLRTVEKGVETVKYIPRYQETYSGYSIVNYVKVRKDASVFDGDHGYWEKRVIHDITSKIKINLLKRQKRRCAICEARFKPGDILEIDHIVEQKRGNARKWNNIRLVHGHCHDQRYFLESLQVKQD